MKLDIKSFLIGILTTLNLFLLMGFDDHKEEKEIGRYQASLDQGGILIALLVWAKYKLDEPL